MPVKFQGSGSKKETKRERKKWQKENEKKKGGKGYNSENQSILIL